MLWNELVKMALLGADRCQLSAAASEALSNYGIDICQPLNQLLLEGIAIQANLERAGFSPKLLQATPLPAVPEESLSSCSEKSVQHLTAILTGAYAGALEEFVQEMQTRQKRLPPILLPDLFDICLKKKELWQQLRLIIGERGNWLLSLNPAWRLLAIEPSDNIWQTGSRKERTAMLRELRRQSPMDGLKYLLSTWPEESLSDKVAFLKCLSVGLSDMDEVFLEECLDFSRKEVREVAASLLKKLPGSRLQQRMWKYVSPFVKIKPGQQVEFNLPHSPSKEVIRDGINPELKWKRGGAATSILYQMLALVPPVQWEKHLKLEPPGIIALFANNERGFAAVEGLIAATALHGSTTWMEPLLQFWLDNQTNEFSKLDIAILLTELPDAVFNKMMIQRLKASPILPPEHSPLVFLLKKANNRWEKGLNRLFMQQLKTWIKENTTYSWTGLEYRNILKRAAYWIPTEEENWLSQFWLTDSNHWAGWERDLQNLISTVSFRKEMKKELRNV